MFKLRGSRSAVQGRPRQATRLVVQMAVGEDDETDGGGCETQAANQEKEVSSWSRA